MSDEDSIIEGLRSIRISMTPGSRMLISQVPAPRKQLRILREAETEILRLRKQVAKVQVGRVVRF